MSSPFQTTYCRHVVNVFLTCQMSCRLGGPDDMSADDIANVEHRVSQSKHNISANSGSLTTFQCSYSISEVCSSRSCDTKMKIRVKIYLLLCVCLFTIMLTYYCMDLTTKGLWLLDRAKVFTVPPLLVQTISLGDKVLPPSSIARHAGFRSRSMFTMIVLRCLVRFPC